MTIRSSGARPPRVFPGFESLYVATATPAARAFVARLRWPQPASTEEITRALAAGRSPEGVSAAWAYGAKEPGDVVCHDFGVAPIVSPRFLATLTENGVTGWTPVPCELCGRQGEIFPDYALLTVHGRCGPIDDRRTEWVTEVRDGQEYAFMKGVYFDPATWDGCDMFQSPEGVLFFTGAVKRLLQAQRIRGFRLEPAARLRRPIPPPGMETFH